jgi:Transglycosylase SLT domain
MAVNLANPQTWNRYAYVLNNPLQYRDPLGLYCFYGGEGDTPENDSDRTDYDFAASDASDCGEGGQWIDNPSTTVTVSAGGDNGNTLSTFPSDISQNFQFIPGSGCSAALRTAHANSGAMNRYYNTYQGTITNAANANGINPFFVVAVGIRESGLQNIPQQGGGQGLGVFQIDLGAHPNVSPSQALDPAFSANFAANMLSSNMSTLASSHPNLNSAQLLQATAASYNFGVGNISGNPNTIDVGTTGNNYGSNVVALTNNCF